MIGINKPAMAIAGSGNMGLTATLPIIAYDEIKGHDEEKLTKSITLSALTTIYSAYHSSYISAMCGCVNRGGIELFLVYPIIYLDLIELKKVLKALQQTFQESFVTEEKLAVL